MAVLPLPESPWRKSDLAELMAGPSWSIMPARAPGRTKPSSTVCRVTCAWLDRLRARPSGGTARAAPAPAPRTGSTLERLARPVAAGAGQVEDVARPAGSGGAPDLDEAALLQGQQLLVHDGNGRQSDLGQLLAGASALHVERLEQQVGDELLGQPGIVERRRDGRTAGGSIGIRGRYAGSPWPSLRSDCGSCVLRRRFARRAGRPDRCRCSRGCRPAAPARGRHPGATGSAVRARAPAYSPTTRPSRDRGTPRRAGTACRTCAPSGRAEQQAFARLERRPAQQSAQPAPPAVRQPTPAPSSVSRSAFTHLHRRSHALPSVRTIAISAGPRITTNIAGKTKKTSGKISLIVVLAAASSARWRRLVRSVSAWTRSASAIEVPNRSVWISMVTSDADVGQAGAIGEIAQRLFARRAGPDLQIDQGELLAHERAHVDDLLGRPGAEPG